MKTRRKLNSQIHYVCIFYTFKCFHAIKKATKTSNKAEKTRQKLKFQ